MNELQQVLLILALIVVAGLYLVHLRKQRSTKNTSESGSEAKPKMETSGNSTSAKDSPGLNSLGEPHIPLSPKTAGRLGVGEAVEETPELSPKTHESASQSSAVNEPHVPDNQLGFSFDEEHEKPQATTAHQQQLHVDLDVSDGNSDYVNDASTKKPKHIVIEDTEMMSVAGFSAEDSKATADDVPSFGIPKDQPPASANVSKDVKVAEKTDPELYIIIVMGTEEYPWPKVNQTLQGVGLKPSDQSIFVKYDSMGNEIIKVANLLEPGVFPVEEPSNHEFKTPGVVMILELPTTVKAPAAMHEMIMMARKISQRLNGRMYNAERQLMRESDLQQMRDAAVAYESVAMSK